MDIDQVSCFVACAQTLNFSRAAEKLHITQSAVSRRVERLEAELGATLFVREHAGIRLTPAGTDCLPDMREILRCVEAIRARARGDAPRALNVACYGYHDQKLVANACKLTYARYPNLCVNVYRAYAGSAADDLRRGRADIILTEKQEVQHLENTGIVQLNCPGWAAILLANSPLAQKSRLCLADLQPLPLVTGARYLSPNCYDNILSSFRKANCTPQVMIVRDNREDVLLAIITNRGFAVFSTLSARDIPSELKAVPLSGIEGDNVFVAAYNRERLSPELKTFLQALRRSVPLLDN